MSKHTSLKGIKWKEKMEMDLMEKIMATAVAIFCRYFPINAMETNKARRLYWKSSMQFCWCTVCV